MRKMMVMKKIIFTLMLLPTFVFAQENNIVDAAFEYDADFIYFIKGDNLVKYDFKKDKTLHVKKLSENALPGVTFTQIDAALSYNGKKVYFFSGNQYIRFDLNNFRADNGYPQPNSSWEFGFNYIDAALDWTNNSYAFHGNQYSRYSKRKFKTDEGYPNTLSNSTWPGLDFNKIDAALSVQTGKSYFFRGNQYIRYDQALDKADSGYPQQINDSTWPGLIDALSSNESNENNDNENNEEIVNNTDAFSATKFNISLNTPISDPSSILASSALRATPDGGFYLIYPNESTVYIQKINKNLHKQGSPIIINDYWFSDMYVHTDGSAALLLGRSVNNTYLGNYPNSLYFIKMDTNGSLSSPKLIFGENPHTAGSSWFDGRSNGLIEYNGFEYGFYFEVQKNWAEPGQEDDIHNGDMFVATDLDGNKKEDRKHFWTASHSSTVKIAAKPNGDFFTLTIGDSYPYGLQFYNRNTSFNKVIWPPKEDFVPYEKCNSSNAAGILDYMAISGNEIVAIMGTLEHPNIGPFDKVDPLFLKFDFNGNITKRTWLAQTPENESLISVIKLKNNQYVIAWSAGNVYKNDWKSDNMTISVIDAIGNFVIEPQKTNYPFGTFSNLIQLTDGSIVWATTEQNHVSNIDFYVGRIK